MNEREKLVRVAPAASLFFLSPLIAEFLLGDFPLTWLPLVLVLAPMYGSGALLVREISLRFGCGWPGRFALAVAFGIIEEAYTTQSLFNPDYLGLHLLAYGWVPQLGIGLPWTVFVIGIHTIWSMAVPIALTEALFPSRAAARWLGPIGMVCITVLFWAGCLLLARSELSRDPFVAKPAQFAWAGATVIALGALAFLLGRWISAPRPTRFAPRPTLLMAETLVATSVFMALSRLSAWIPAEVNVAAALLLLAAGALLVWRWSGASGWSARHRLALTTGAIATYGWWGIYQKPVVPTPPALDLASNILFAGGAAALLALANRRLAAR